MKTVIGNAIISLANKAEHAQTPHESMNYAQAALNLANAYTAMAYAALEENRQREQDAVNRLAPEKEKRE